MIAGEMVPSPDVTSNTMWRLKFADDVTDEQIRSIVDDEGMPVYVDLNNNVMREIPSESTISQINEKLFIPLGISVSVLNHDFQIYTDELIEYFDADSAGGYNYINKTTFGQVDMLASSVEAADGSTPWISVFPDQDDDYPSNWIRSGKQSDGNWDFGDADEVYSRWKKEDFFLPLTFENSVDILRFVGGNSSLRAWRDPASQFETAVGGGWAPYVLTSPYDGGPQAMLVQVDSTGVEGVPSDPRRMYYNFMDLLPLDEPVGTNFNIRNPGFNPTLTNIYSVDVVYTPNKDLWTRCVVLEACDNPEKSIGGALKQEPRKSLSVGKDGKPDGSSDGFGEGGSEGMGWFPGYAINVETGERLNIMFAENSSLPNDNGTDMIFNPTQTYGYMKTDTGNVAIGQADFEFLLDQAKAVQDYDVAPILSMGGMHYIYVVGSSGNTSAFYLDRTLEDLFQTRSWNGADYTSRQVPVNPVTEGFLAGNVKNGNDGEGDSWFDCGVYDEGRWLRNKFNSVLATSQDQIQRTQHKMQLFNNVMWTSIPTQAFFQEENWLANDVTVKLRVSRPYMRYSSRWYADPTQAPAEQIQSNNGWPRYQFTTKDIAPDFKQAEVIGQTILDEINIVPNPYYGFSTYESTALENYVKIVNLPEVCDISIYTVNGTLIRTINKIDAGTTFVQWDLKNQANIPIGGGVYLIYVDAPGIGNRTLKFFCAMRPTDLNAF